jgi:nucleoid DNA-binding protein
MVEFEMFGMFETFERVERVGGGPGLSKAG